MVQKALNNVKVSINDSNGLFFPRYFFLQQSHPFLSSRLSSFSSPPHSARLSYEPRHLCSCVVVPVVSDVGPTISSVYPRFYYCYSVTREHNAIIHAWHNMIGRSPEEIAVSHMGGNQNSVRAVSESAWDGTILIQAFIDSSSL